MKKLRLILLLLLAAVLVAVGARWAGRKDAATRDRYSVLVVADPELGRKYAPVLAAYKSVLQEEGIPYTVVDPYYLLSMRPSDAVLSSPAVILPDTVAQSLPADLGWWLERYLTAGGSVAVIYDAGTRDKGGNYRVEALPTRLTGVNYILYDRLREKAYTTGNIEFKDKRSAEFFQIPPGKTFHRKLLAGYAYDPIQYPTARVERKNWFNERDVYAYAVTREKEKLPAIVLRKAGGGNVLYVNLPLGSLKAYSDDLPLRSVLRTFLFTVLRLPHLANTNGGRGGIVVNWHIDSNNEFQNIPQMLDQGYLRPSLQYSFHVSAGDFRDRPGDGLGFDAMGKGRKYLEELMPYGVVGSHGGWGHNWFTEKIIKNRFGEKEIEENIRKNNAALETVTGKKIIEYSAPNGVHPQPVTTRVLERLGITAYYYIGDSGSAPNRTFIFGNMISDKVIAFPIMTFGRATSFYEMQILKKTEAEVARWLRSTVDYAVENHTVRLIYFHPYNIADYPAAISGFLDYLEKKQKQGKLDVRPMSYFSSFMLRFLKTEVVFHPRDGGLAVECDNPEGLAGITVVLPAERYGKPSGPGLSVRERDGYYYCTFTGNDKQKTIQIPAMNKGTL